MAQNMNILLCKNIGWTKFKKIVLFYVTSSYDKSCLRRFLDRFFTLKMQGHEQTIELYKNFMRQAVVHRSSHIKI